MTIRSFFRSAIRQAKAERKKELLYRIPTYKMKRSVVASIIFRYVFTYYNRQRIYTANPDGLPPAAYRQLIEDASRAA